MTAMPASRGWLPSPSPSLGCEQPQPQPPLLPLLPLPHGQPSPAGSSGPLLSSPDLPAEPPFQPPRPALLTALPSSLAAAAAAAPLCRYNDGIGARPLGVIEHDLKPLTSADVFMMNIGAHAIRRLPYAEFKEYVGSIAAMLAGSPAATFWRTSIPVAEHYFRLLNASRFFSDGHFQVGWHGWVGEWVGWWVGQGGVSLPGSVGELFCGGRCRA